MPSPTSGVDQVSISSRLTRHSSWPSIEARPLNTAALHTTVTISGLAGYMVCASLLNNSEGRFG